MSVEVYDPAMVFVGCVGNNVKRMTFDVDAKEWLIEYKNDLKPDVVASEDLTEFMQNA